MPRASGQRRQLYVYSHASDQRPASRLTSLSRRAVPLGACGDATVYVRPVPKNTTSHAGALHLLGLSRRTARLGHVSFSRPRATQAAQAAMEWAVMAVLEQKSAILHFDVADPSHRKHRNDAAPHPPTFAFSWRRVASARDGRVVNTVLKTTRALNRAEWEPLAVLQLCTTRVLFALGLVELVGRAHVSAVVQTTDTDLLAPQTDWLAPIQASPTSPNRKAITGVSIMQCNLNLS